MLLSPQMLQGCESGISKEKTEIMRNIFVCNGRELLRNISSVPRHWPILSKARLSKLELVFWMPGLGICYVG